MPAAPTFDHPGQTRVIESDEDPLADSQMRQSA
jgi:hypothetical protein